MKIRYLNGDEAQAIVKPSFVYILKNPSSEVKNKILSLRTEKKGTNEI